VVTGGSRGIGLATARLLAEAGAAVVVCARSAEAVEEAAAGLRAAGHHAAGVPCDVTDDSQVEALRAAAEEALGGGVDVLVNNAGVADSAPLARTSLATWNRLMAVNATGTFLCTRAFAPAMVERGWGRVVNVASVAGKAGAPYVSAYVAAKHAVVGFTRAVAAELAATGVTVNAVCPGYVDTEMTAESVARIAGTTRLDEAAARRALEQQSPQGRIYTAEEVAYQVLALCDPRAGGVNGQAVVLDGGRVQS
jgi:NAD(P)-dependent dehydrogenase (short-subunit alcohol dehydrogenase family)